MKHENLKKAVSLTAVAAISLAPALSLADTAASALVKGGALNLRETASLEAKVLGQYPTGTLIEITEQGAEWSKVFVSGKAGYMMTKYLDSANAAIAATVRTNTGIGLNLREQPSLAGKIITAAKNGAKVTVLQKGASWSRVDVEGKVGFMATQYLNFGSGSASVPVGSKTAVVNNPRDTQVLNLRETASLDAKVLAYYRNGAKVTVLEEGKTWCKVKTADGKVGYMMTQYLKLSESAKPVDPTTATTFNWNGGKIVNFRSAPNLNKSSVQGTVPVGTKVTVLEHGTDWCKVEVDGKTGYMSTWFLKW